LIIVRAFEFYGRVLYGRVSMIPPEAMLWVYKNIKLLIVLLITFLVATVILVVLFIKRR